jgi:hypothetical protein
MDVGSGVQGHRAPLLWSRAVQLATGTDGDRSRCIRSRLFRGAMPRGPVANPLGGLMVLATIDPSLEEKGILARTLLT